jgi:DNA-binding transcriptional MocR family regulator
LDFHVDTGTVVRQLGVWSSGKGSLQQKLARALMEVIRHGDVAPGLRLPSERALAHALKISRTTVVAAYDALRELGWLESRSGSGTWVCVRSADVTAARQSAREVELAASPLLGLLGHRSDDDAIDMALGTPLPLTELPNELFALPPDEHEALLRDRGYYPYGLPALRRAIAAELSKNGLASSADHVLVTNGAQHAFMLCAMHALQRGDTALLEDPTYFGAIDACRAVGARIATVPVGPGGVSAPAIRGRVIATAARLIYLTTTCQNPTGAVMPVAVRKEVAGLVAEFGVTLIDDRTMADLVLEGHAPPPLAAFAGDHPVLTIGSLSKLLWPGLRVGWIRAPEPIVQRLARLKTTMDLGSPLVTQAIAVRLFDALDRVRALRRQQLKSRRDLLAALLRERLPEWKFRLPHGGLFFWVELPGGDAREFAQFAARHGVVTLPGSTLSADGAHTSFLRLPFLAEPETLRRAVDRLATAARLFTSGGRSTRTRVPVLQ